MLKYKEEWARIPRDQSGKKNDADWNQEKLTWLDQSTWVRGPEIEITVKKPWPWLTHG